MKKSLQAIDKLYLDICNAKVSSPPEIRFFINRTNNYQRADLLEEFLSQNRQHIIKLEELQEVFRSNFVDGQGRSMKSMISMAEELSPPRHTTALKKHIADIATFSNRIERMKFASTSTDHKPAK